MIMMMRISWGHWWWIMIWQWWWDHPCNPPLRWRRSKQTQEQDVLTMYFRVLYFVFVQLFMMIFSHTNKVCIYFHQCIYKIADEKNSVNFHYNLILISHNSSFQLVTAILSMTLGQECLAWVFFLCWSILETGSPSPSYIGKAQSSLKCPNQIAAQPAFYCFVHETQEQAP